MRVANRTPIDRVVKVRGDSSFWSEKMMTKAKKTFYGPAVGFGVLVILLALFFLLAPRLVNLESLKTRAESAFSEKTGGQLDFQKADLSFFPRPGLVVYKLNFSIPDQLSGQVAALTVYPRLLPLLTGDVRIGGIRVVRPDLLVSDAVLPHKMKKEAGATAQAVLPAVAGLPTMIPHLKVDVEDGRLAVSDKKRAVFSFQKINARAVLGEKKSFVRLVCTSDLWETFSIKADSSPGGTGVGGQLSIGQFQPHRLQAVLQPDASRTIAASRVNLNVNFKGTGLNALQGRFTGDIPFLKLQRGEARTTVEADSLKGGFRIDPEAIEVTVDEMAFTHPRLDLAGRFHRDRKANQTTLELEGRDVDASGARETALAAAGDMPTVARIFEILKGGRVSRVTFRTHGSSTDGLGALQNLTLSGKLRDGRIFIPGFEREVDQVRGDVVISDGVLEGRNLSARLEKSLAKNGTLLLGLTGDDAVFNLDLSINADLAQLPPVLEQYVGSKRFLRELALIDQLEGTAAGRLVLGERLSAIRARVAVGDFKVGAAYRRFPFPIDLKGRGFTYDGDGIAFQGLQGTVGQSIIADLSGGIALADTPRIEISDGRFMMVLEEIYPWLDTFGDSRFQEAFKRATGMVSASRMHLKGPLLEPGRWQLDAVGECLGLNLESPHLPDRFTVEKAHFHVVQGSDGEKFSFSEAAVSFLDADLTLSGMFHNGLRHLDHIETLFTGKIGPDANRWLSTRFGLAPELALRAPVSVSAAHLSWAKDIETLFSGDLKFERGPDLRLDLASRPGEFRIRNITVTDAASHASGSLSILGKAIDGRFEGRIASATSDRIFVESGLPDGWIDGRIQAHLDLGAPGKSRVSGTLKGGDLKLLRFLDFPLDLDRFALAAQGNTASIETAALVWGDEKLDLTGDAVFSEAGLHLDMDLSAEGINADRVREVLTKRKVSGNEKRDNRRSVFPVSGVIRLNTGSLVYNQNNWTPFRAVVEFDRDGVRVTVNQAEISGISTPGVAALKKSPEDLALEFNTRASGRPLAPVVAWLSGGTEKITGVFDLDGKISAQGTPDTVRESLTGEFEFEARNGSVFRALLLSNILTYLNATEVLLGKNPGIGREGFDYKKFTIKATLENGRLRLNEVFMDGASMELVCQGDIDLTTRQLDLTVVVAPLKTVDRVIKMTPLVGYLLQGTLVSIPLKVTGDYARPKISILPVSAVGRGLMGIMERTFKLPLKIIEPILPNGKK